MLKIKKIVFRINVYFLLPDMLHNNLKSKILMVFRFDGRQSKIQCRQQCKHVGLNKGHQ